MFKNCSCSCIPERMIKSNITNNEIVEWINQFCNNTDEFKGLELFNYKIKFVDDIYSFIKEDDINYAENYMHPNNVYYGLTYVNKYNNLDKLHEIQTTKQNINYLAVYGNYFLPYVVPIDKNQ